MTPFKENITDSIDNLNNLISRVNATGEKFDTVYTSEENIDNMLENNVDSKSGSDVSINNTVDGGKFEWEIQGNCEQDTIAYIDVGTWEQGTILSTNGEEATSTTEIRTDDFVAVNPNVLYNITRSIATSYQNYRFYDSNKTYLGIQTTEGMVTTNRTNSGNRMLTNVTSMTMIINNTNVAYMRMTDNSNDLSTQYTISTQAPTPDYPKDIRVVTGDNGVVVSNSDNTQSQTITLHLGTNYLAGIDTYDDEIVGKTDDWKIRRKALKHIFNGTESFGLNNKYAYGNSFACYDFQPIISKASATNIMSNMLKGTTESVANGIRIATGSGNVIMTFEADFSTFDLDEFTAKITQLYNNNNPLVIYIPLATPTEETITDTQLISDLNNMYNAMGYDGQTNISITPSSGNATPSLKVTGFVTEKEV